MGGADLVGFLSAGLVAPSSDAPAIPRITEALIGRLDYKDEEGLGNSVQYSTLIWHKGYGYLISPY